MKHENLRRTAQILGAMGWQRASTVVVCHCNINTTGFIHVFLIQIEPRLSSKLYKN